MSPAPGLRSATAAARTATPSEAAEFGSTNRLHIGMVLPSLGGGGAERVTLELAQALMARGHRVDILLARFIVAYTDTLPTGMRLFRPRFWPPGEAARRCRARGVRVCNLDLAPSIRDWQALTAEKRRASVRLKQVLYACAIARYLRAERPDLLLAALPQAETAAFCAATLDSGATPVAVALHGDPMHDEPLHGERLRMARMLFPMAAAVFAVSHGVGAEAEQALDLPPGTVKTIYNSVPAAKVRRLANEKVDHPWFNDAGPPVVLTVGRESKQKDYGTLLEAFARTRRDMPVRLAILGRFTDRFRKHLAAQARTLGVADDMAFLDFDPNPFRYMRRAALFVFSSRSEGLPTVLIEALACGTPVVSTDTPHGPAEILCDGKFGKLVPMGAPEPMAQAILATLRGDRPAPEALERRADDFSCARAAEQYEATFAKIVDDAQRCAGS